MKFATTILLLSILVPRSHAQELLLHWPLLGDAKDRSSGGRDAINQGVKLAKDGATFTGRGFLESKITLGTKDFTFAAWVEFERGLDAVSGDVVSLYDAVGRRGFHVTIKSSAVTTSQANARHLQFGIDNGKSSTWTDCGKPGNTLLAFALTVHDGHLYAGTCEPGKSETGRVYRYDGDKRWVDCGSPAMCNSVTALAVHDGRLYAGVGKYRLAGSALKESENLNPGGRIFRYEGGSKWTDVGGLPDAEAVGGLVVYRGHLYSSSLYRPAGFYRYEGGSKWTDCGTPGGKRVVALAVHGDFLYASSYDGGRVYRYDGKSWTDWGRLGDSTQTYSFATYQGRLFVGTWPSGRVYRFEDVDRWTDVGRLGDEMEVMGMIVHNGRLLAGTLPLAEVYQYDGNDRWTKLARLDHTPAVRYRRAWTAAEHQGRVYFSTLPSGIIHSFAAGTSVAWEKNVAPGWHHVAAVKRGGRLELYLDGRRVAQSAEFEAKDYDLGSGALRVGFGATDSFRGRMRDVRLYGRGVGVEEIQSLAKQ